MFNVRPDALSPWLYVEPPTADEVPGFRMPPDGPVRDAPRIASPGSFGFDPSASLSPSMGTGFLDAMRFAPGNVYPEAYLTGPSDFAPPPRHSLQDALDQIMRIYAPFAPRYSGPFEPPGSGTNAVSPNINRLASPYEPRAWSPVPLDSTPPVQSDSALKTIGPLGSLTSGLAGLEAEPNPPQGQESLRVPDGQRSSQPWAQVNRPADLNGEPLLNWGPTAGQLVSLPSSTAGEFIQPVVSDGAPSVTTSPVEEIQVAQAQPSNPKQQHQKQRPSVNPNLHGPASELGLQVRATQRLNTQLARMDAWEKMIRQPLPETLQPWMQKPLPADWEGTLTKINPSYLKWTKAAAEKYNIPPELLARLFYRESDYIRNRVSGAGAKGIAQLMPIAVKALGLDPRTFDYFDAEKSINAGAALLAKYYDEFKDWPKAVAAYNMGNTAVNNWLAGDQPHGPNRETQDVLKYVFRGDPYAFRRKQ
jgi:soluble lytic murein transglycosylase-like protein